MVTPSLDTPAWHRVVELAREMGVSDAALKKWRQRGVPPEWHLRLIRAGDLPVDVFDERETSESTA
jgi:hypothetical protein